MVFRYPARIDFSGELPRPVADAVALQKDLRSQVLIENDFPRLKTIAGVDVGYDLKRELTKAVVAVMDYETLTLQTSVIAYAHTDFPYISGLLAFREIPAILKALDCLPEKPDILMVDGQGVSHPRRMGIAAHLGIVSGLPSIGVAKSRLTGKFAPLGNAALSQSPLTDKGEDIGAVLRSKNKRNPLFVSAGHLVSHETALEITLHCLKGYRLPEPTRIADQISKWKLDVADEKDPPLLAGDLFGSIGNV